MARSCEYQTASQVSTDGRATRCCSIRDLTLPSHSPLRGGREGPLRLVPRSQLYRVHERDVQEGQCAREINRLVPLGPQAASLRPQDQRAVQALHTKPTPGHHRRTTKGGWRAHRRLLCGGRDQGCMLLTCDHPACLLSPALTKYEFVGRHNSIQDVRQHSIHYRGRGGGRDRRRASAS